MQIEKYTCWTLPPLRSLRSPALHARPASVGHGPHACAPAEAKPRVRCCLHVCTSRAQQLQAPLSSNPVLEGTDQLPEPGDVVRQASIWPGHAAAPGPTLKSLEALGSNRLPITSISQAMAPEPIGGNPNAGFAEKRLTVPARFISNVAAVRRPAGAFRSCRCGVAIFGNLSREGRGDDVYIDACCCGCCISDVQFYVSRGVHKSRD